MDRALRALGERFSMGVILFDGRLDLIWASGATPGVVGWDVDEILGRNVLDLVHPDDIERVMPMLEVALDDPLARLNRSSSVRTAELSVRVTDPGGGWRTVLVAGCVIDLDGNLVVTVRPAEERVAFDRVLQLLGRGERLSMTLDAVLDVVRAHFEQPACIVHSVDGSTVVEGDPEALVFDDADDLLAALRDRSGSRESVDANRWVFTVLSPGRSGAVAARPRSAFLPAHRCWWAWCAVWRSGRLARLFPGPRTGRPRYAHTCGRCPSLRRCGLWPIRLDTAAR